LGEWKDLRVVVKTLSFSEMPAWKNLELFEREAQTLKNLEHPSLPRLLDWGKGENGIYLITAYITGETLAEKLSSGWHPSEPEIRELAQQLLEILIFLHSLNPPLIHRDIKPKNLVLNTEGKLFLIDFGAVSQLLTPEGSSTVAGTFGYMAPEQFAGKAIPQSDLYGLAATLVHLLTGRAPAELPQKRLRLDFESYAHCSPELIAWLQSLLDPLPEDRCPNAARALAQLKQPRTTPNEIAMRASHQTLALPADSVLQVSSDQNQTKIIVPPQDLNSKQKQLLWMRQGVQLTSLATSYLSLLVALLGARIYGSDMILPLFMLSFLPTAAWFTFAERKARIRLTGSSKQLQLTANALQIDTYSPLDDPQSQKLPLGEIAEIRLKNDSWDLNFETQRDGILILAHNEKRYTLGETLSKTDQAWLVGRLQAHLENRQTSLKEGKSLPN
jgi:eukaryotic-like serine/threonine-protein kinase